MTRGPTALVWFRRDLRLADQPALAAALACDAYVVPCYIHAPLEEAPWPPGAASRWWLHGALESLDAGLRALGSRLVLRIGATDAELDRLIAETGATAVYWNRLYEPAVIARDARVEANLRARDIDAHSENAALLAEPWTVGTKTGTPFRVFTPFWNALARQLDQVPPPIPAPASLPRVPRSIESRALAGLDLAPKLGWAAGMAAAWNPTEAGAQEQLERLTEETVAGYREHRDLPGHAGTSRLSPYLHFGQLSPRQVLHALRPRSPARRSRRARKLPAPAVDAYLRQIGWREFAHHLLYHFPHTAELPFQPEFTRLPVRRDPAALHAWQRGRTGIPLVDAGMRELWQTGWMHNRARMIVASFFTKNLGLPWLEGARWFWDTLVDADLANNTLGWQWSAGCGADAAPYYRIFNPVAQAQRFDPQRRYVRRWVPEAGTPAYPAPIVDLKESRTRALADYRTLRASLYSSTPPLPLPRRGRGLG